ncbi:PREDICTED: uncharacterized protein LOC109234730 [Nicotiana attenuata]|uniref:uncharacterized protein LOC109234730 n=1 Tax=Nicotiana attenuata TaxID=49451 RepID=UPI000904810A|nr:PREDICTED: uncharacterized protein LOC109234730 [Nicotiana attenuata]
MGKMKREVLLWIGRTVSVELQPSIIYASNAKTVWNEFKERFNKSNLTRFYLLWIQIGLLKQVGLNESYSQVRNQILLKTPVVTVNQAYALVIQEESQRELGVLEVNRDP